MEGYICSTNWPASLERGLLMGSPDLSFNIQKWLGHLNFDKCVILLYDLSCPYIWTYSAYICMMGIFDCFFNWYSLWLLLQTL